MLPKRRLLKAKRTVGCHYVPVLKERARLSVLKDSLPNPAWVSLGNVVYQMDADVFVELT